MLPSLAFAGKNGREMGFHNVCGTQRRIDFGVPITGCSRGKTSSCLKGFRADSEFFKN